MSLFFSGAVTSSPIKRRLRSSVQSLDSSLLSPDSSYVCYSSPDGADPCSCRRSPRLLTNGYYDVTDDSFAWDGDGNVSLTPCKASVSYKENLVRVFRRRRRPRSSLVRLLSDVTETCQSWLDENVFRGVFRTAQNRDQNQNWDQDQNRDQDQEVEESRDKDQDHQADWTRTSLDDSFWSGISTSTELDDGRSFTYDPTEVPPPPDKEALPPKMLIQEEICSEICQSQERFTQSLAGLSEVPPPSVFYAGGRCCGPAPEHTGFTMTTLLLFILSIFILTALYSGCLCRGVTVATTVFIAISTVMLLSKSGPMGEWRRAKTEDITSRNE